MLRWSFSRRGSGAPHGFDLGDIEVAGPEGFATSRGKKPDQGMMIYLAIVELLDGLRRAFSAKGKLQYEFVGTDSSFSLAFERKKSGQGVAVRSGKSMIGTVSERDLIQGLLDAVSGFLAAENALSAQDAVQSDLAAAMGQFRQLGIANGAKGR